MSARPESARQVGSARVSVQLTPDQARHLALALETAADLGDVNVEIASAWFSHAVDDRPSESKAPEHRVGVIAGEKQPALAITTPKDVTWFELPKAAKAT